MDSIKKIGSQVRVHLTTRDPDIKLPEDTGQFLVPTEINRYALSTLVNSLLEGETRIPVEFLIDGQPLRTTIAKFLASNNISSEATLPLEVTRAFEPPTQVFSFEHDDWVSTVDTLSATSPAGLGAGKNAAITLENPRILSGSYNGLLRVWSSSGQLIATSPATSDGVLVQGIKAARFFTPSRVVSSGNDRAIRIWKYEEAIASSDGSSHSAAGKFTPLLELFGHKSSVDNISVHAPTCRVLSASSDHTVGFWSTRASDAPIAPANLLPSASHNAAKRRKLNATASATAAQQRGPLSLLKGHSAPVTAATFSEKDCTVGYSTSWDHTLITWDLTTGTQVSTRRTLHPLLSITEMIELGLLVTGTSARHISMIDPRVDARDVASLTLRGHTGPVIGASTQPGYSWGLVSGSHDGTCRIWDLRSRQVKSTSSMRLDGGMAGQTCESVSVIQRESLSGDEKRRVAGDGIKVFGVCWDREIGIVSAGEDKRVQVNRSTDH